MILFEIKIQMLKKPFAFASYAMTGLPRGHSGKESACNVGDPGSTLGWGDPLEKGMAPHSSILARKIPWTEEPGGLQSMGSQRVGHS